MPWVSVRGRARLGGGGRRGLCALLPHAQANERSSLHRQHLPLCLPFTFVLLLHLAVGRCFYRREEWWSYELCYKKALRQYHGEGAAVVAQFSLGRYSSGGGGGSGSGSSGGSSSGGSGADTQQKEALRPEDEVQVGVH